MTTKAPTYQKATQITDSTSVPADCSNDCCRSTHDETLVPKLTLRTLRDALQNVVDYACAQELITWDDRVWAYNTLLDTIGACRPGPESAWVLALEQKEHTSRDTGLAWGTVHGDEAGDPLDLDAALEIIAGAAVRNGIVEDTASGRDRVAMRVMGALMPTPSNIIEAFANRLRIGNAHDATDWFYRLCCNAGYVRRSAIAHNIQWNTSTKWGDLEITINLSKPEKDPRDIAAAGAAPQTGETYPACQLCIENEGYPGRSAADPAGTHPARQNLRIIPIKLGEERWGFQYSPYAYFSEHCIAMSSIHRPMHIDRVALGCLLDFVDLFPHYCIGSNADLPIVGGSILSHDHFQGGAHVFPMMRAAAASTFMLSGFPDIEGAVLTWPLSVLRLRSDIRDELLNACTHVIDAWRGWSDEQAGVIARTPDGVPHNTVTPIIRRVDGAGMVGGDHYEAYLALRCNITSKEHPLGVFHPHAEHHHIKKENIGLIEVMGLAVLPSRLKAEIEALYTVLSQSASKGVTAQEVGRELEADPHCSAHAAWALDVYRRRMTALTSEDAMGILREEVGYVFAHVLEDAGVFKWDTAGRAAQQRFINSL